MSHMKIASKILEVIRAIPDEQSFGKLNEALLEQKLITQIEYGISESKERTTTQGVVWHLVTVSCKLTIIDAESDETMVNIAFGSGVDQGDKAVAKAATMAWRYAWLGALNIAVDYLAEGPSTEAVREVATPEFVVETPESKIIAEIKAMWKWGEADLEPYVFKKRGKGLTEMNLPELTVERNDLEGYIRGNR